MIMTTNCHSLNALKNTAFICLSMLFMVSLTALNTEGVYTGEYLMTVGFNPDITERRSSVILEINEVK